MKAGEYVMARMDAVLPEGIRLYLPEGDEIFAVPDQGFPFQAGREVRLFLWRRDREGRWWGSLSRPALELGQVDFLEVADNGPAGCFLNWNMPRHLFCPPDRSGPMLTPGMVVPVRLVEDLRTGGLMGNLNWKAGVLPADESYTRGRSVSLLVMGETDIGYAVLADHLYLGMVYYNQTFEGLRAGQKRKGFVNFLREDGRLDVLLRPPGYKAVTEAEQAVLALLRKAGGSMPYGDKTSPDIIQSVFGMSKKVFKQAVGGLFRKGLVQPFPERLVWLEEEGD
jgi:predicted RNA-binding protein (virulence factor B family)